MSDEATQSFVPVSLGEQLDEARRELGMKEHFYPRWVGEGRKGYTKEIVAKRIAATKSTVLLLERLVREEQERLQPTLFGD